MQASLGKGVQKRIGDPWRELHATLSLFPHVSRWNSRIVQVFSFSLQSSIGVRYKTKNWVCFWSNYEAISTFADSIILAIILGLTNHFTIWIFILIVSLFLDLIQTINYVCTLVSVISSSLNYIQEKILRNKRLTLLLQIRNI